MRSSSSLPSLSPSAPPVAPARAGLGGGSNFETRSTSLRTRCLASDVQKAKAGIGPKEHWHKRQSHRGRGASIVCDTHKTAKLYHTDGSRMSAADGWGFSRRGFIDLIEKLSFVGSGRSRAGGRETPEKDRGRRPTAI